MSTGNRKDTLSDVLNLPVLRLNRFGSDVVSLILRLYLLSYTIELVQVLLSVLLFLLLFVHAITSGIVCAGTPKLYYVKPVVAPGRGAHPCTSAVDDMPA